MDWTECSFCHLCPVSLTVDLKNLLTYARAMIVNVVLLLNRVRSVINADVLIFCCTGLSMSQSESPMM